MQQNFKERLRNRETLVGPLVTLASSDVADILAGVGFDWLWIEMEHAPTGLADVQRMLQAVGDRCPVLVRVPWGDHVWVKRVLDLGCSGVIIPQVKSVADAREAVRACKYPPSGIRSVGIGRAQGYGMGLQDYIDGANDRLVIVLQIEHIDAVERVDEIIAVGGFDAILIGPYDLSCSMGLVGQIRHADVQAAIARIRSAAVKAGIPIGIFAPDAAAAKALVAAGCSLIALGTDSMLLWKGAKQQLAELRAN